MVRILRRSPSYALKDVKALIKADNILFGRDAFRYALVEFGWHVDEMKKCLLKLNDRYHFDDPQKNHFYKTANHFSFPNTMMDYYKAKNILQGFDIYTHFYIHPEDGRLIVDSFKDLGV
jgi:uncharacterized protein YxjI